MEVRDLTGQPGQLGPGALLRARLAQNLSAQAAQLIAADHRGFRPCAGDRGGLVPRQPQGGVRNILVRLQAFVDLRSVAAETQAKPLQLLPAVWGGRGQDQIRVVFQSGIH